MHGLEHFLEGRDVGVNEVYALLVRCVLLCFLNSGFPCLALGLVEDCKALVKDGALFLAQFFHKVQVADQDIWDHLVHVVGIVLAHVAVAVIGERQLVVLRAVQHLCLQCGVNVAEAHRGGRAAQQLHHGYVGRGLLHADLQAAQVVRRFDGGVDGVEVAGACVQPGNRLKARLLGGFEDGTHDVRVVHRGVVCLRTGEQVGQVEQCVVFREGLKQRVGRDTEGDRAGLCQLHHLVLRTQQFAGEDLDLVLVAQLAFDVFLKSQQAGMGRVVGGLVVADADDVLVIRSRRAAAARQGTQCQHCRQCQRQCANPLFH